MLFEARKISYAAMILVALVAVGFAAPRWIVADEEEGQGGTNSCMAGGQAKPSCVCDAVVVKTWTPGVGITIANVNPGLTETNGCCESQACTKVDCSWAYGDAHRYRVTIPPAPPDPPNPPIPTYYAWQETGGDLETGTDNTFDFNPPNSISPVACGSFATFSMQFAFTRSPNGEIGSGSIQWKCKLCVPPLG